MNFKKLLLIIPVVLALILLFSRSSTSTCANQCSSKNFFQLQFETIDSNSPHSGNIETHFEIYSQATESQQKFKKIQQPVPTSAILCKSNGFTTKTRQFHHLLLASIPLYISYCTIMV